MQNAVEATVASGTRSRSKSEIERRALRAAQGFREAGVGEGDTVALFLRNDFAFFEASLGAMLAGAYAVPVNWHSTAAETRYILGDCAARVLVVHRDLLANVVEALPPDILVLVVDTPPEIAAAYDIAAAATAAAPVAEHANWDAWVASHEPFANPVSASRSAIIYTSGTTGRPKGVKRDPDVNGSLLGTAAVAYVLTGGSSMRVLVNGPMYHSAPNSYARYALQCGADLVLEARFDAEDMLALIERHRITHMHIVPTMFVRLLRLPDAVRARYDVSSLVAVVHGAAPCPPAVKRAMIAWWGPVIHEYYGSTETGLITGHDSAEAIAKPGTVGRALPGVTVRILDDAHAERPAYETGDIYVRSPSLPPFTYIGREDERAAIAAGDFVTLGDVGYLDADGYLFLCDRRRDMIISGGVNIYPAEIEAALLGLDDVADSAVFGIPDDEFGESVCAYVQLRAGRATDAASVRKRLEGTLSRFKIPRTIEFVERLPREDSGKIFKRKLREPYLDRA